MFAQNAIILKNQGMRSKEILQKENDELLRVLESRITYKDDPFMLVEKDLAMTKEFAINNIVK